MLKTVNQRLVSLSLIGLIYGARLTWVGRAIKQPQTVTTAISGTKSMFRLLFFLSMAMAFASGLKLPSFKLLDGRIVGGTDTSITKFPYQISLRLRTGSDTAFSHICGGSIYNERVVITAAHCLSGFVPENLRVVAGVSSLSDIAEHLEVSRLVVHSKYNPYTVDNDVGLIILTKPLVNSDRVKPIPLTENNPADGVEAVVTGWGTTRENGSPSNILQEVTVQIVDNVSCGNSYSSSSITANMICAGVVPGGKDACQGDSGGPIAVNGVLVGIVSWGYGCARAGYPGVYSSVASLRTWIEQNSALYF